MRRSVGGIRIFCHSDTHLHHGPLINETLRERANHMPHPTFTAHTGDPTRIPAAGRRSDRRTHTHAHTTCSHRHRATMNRHKTQVHTPRASARGSEPNGTFDGTSSVAHIRSTCSAAPRLTESPSSCRDLRSHPRHTHRRAADHPPRHPRRHPYWTAILEGERRGAESASHSAHPSRPPPPTTALIRRHRAGAARRASLPTQRAVAGRVRSHRAVESDHPAAAGAVGRGRGLRPIPARSKRRTPRV